ncbi:MAG: alpha/beta fold hydrolase, partial [Anaerolineae bacterium]
LSAKPLRGDWSGENHYAKDAAIAQLFAVMDALGVQRAILVGNSSGGTLALEAALTRPDRVQALILIAPWVYAKRPTLPRWLAGLPQMRRLSLLIGRKLGAKTLLGFSYAHPERVSPERQRLASIHTRMAGWDLAWAELLNRSLSSHVDVGQRLASIRQPAIVITGDGDKLVPMADTKRVSAVLPGATLVVLTDCGHVPQEECPRAFMEAVGAWLESLLSSATPVPDIRPQTGRIAADVNADLQ